jgi:hypothetical protein
MKSPERMRAKRYEIARESRSGVPQVGTGTSSGGSANLSNTGNDS